VFAASAVGGGLAAVSVGKVLALVSFCTQDLISMYLGNWSYGTNLSWSSRSVGSLGGRGLLSAGCCVGHRLLCSVDGIVLGRVALCLCSAERHCRKVRGRGCVIEERVERREGF